MFFRSDSSPLALEEECSSGVQKIVVKDQTSSALIIMGIFFIVVVIGLFYYLPNWSPNARRDDEKKCCNSSPGNHLPLHDDIHQCSENLRDSLLTKSKRTVEDAELK